MLKLENIVVVSDTHAGSSLALCPPEIKLDDGQVIKHSPLQRRIWRHWENLWDWVYESVGRSPFMLVHNGDSVDGVHHKTTALLSANHEIQRRIAVETLQPHVKRCERFIHIRGTEAHAGQSAEDEEAVAKALGAHPNRETGQHSWWKFQTTLGRDLVHFSHHIGGSKTALFHEIDKAFVVAGQWGQRPPTIIVRSHQHCYSKVEPPNCCAVITPGWQAKTPFTHKVDRLGVPQFGGIIIKRSDEGHHVRKKLFFLPNDIDLDNH